MLLSKWLPAGEEKGFGHKHIVDTVLTWKEQILKCIKHVFGDNVTDGFVAQKAVCAKMLYLLGFYFSIWFPGCGFIISQLGLAWTWWEVLSCCTVSAANNRHQNAYSSLPFDDLPFWHFNTTSTTTLITTSASTLITTTKITTTDIRMPGTSSLFFDNLPFC